MQRFPDACLLFTLTAFSPAWAAVENAGKCDMPAELTVPLAPLKQVGVALNTKRNVEILALGSGSTVGDSGGLTGPALAIHTPQRSFPYRMADALRAMKPGVRFNLTVGGGRSMTAESMLQILQHEVAAHHYDLILWQTGTVEAVQGVRPDALRGVLQTGAEAAADAHADLVLVDPQYSRFLRANADLNPYETVLEQMTSTSVATLFHRFDLTQGWVNAGQVDLERVSRDQRDQTIETLNDCLGEALARYVLAGATDH